MSLFRWLNRLIFGAPSQSGQRQGPSASGQITPQPNRIRTESRDRKPVDAARFAPLTRDEALKKAKGLRWRWGAWFGRRDVVPPVSDPRTELIDRAMVGQGLMTAEELAEIHAIGDEMLRLRPELGGAHLQAQQAVARSREDHERLKQQKQAEATERRRKHAEAVAQRRATDIVFLGRGVSGGLSDRRSHVEKLRSLGLPVLDTPADVATALELTIPRLRWLAIHHPASTTTHYTNFSVPKKSGGQRVLSAPKPAIRASQQWILENLLSKVAVRPAAHGFVTGRSTLTNARPHVGHSVIVNTDLSDFFPSTTFPRIWGVFTQLGYSPAAATILALLCSESPRRLVTYNGRRLHVAAGPRSLPQGACTSLALSNIVARRRDSRLNGITTKLGWKYTRYADDCTFSVSDANSAQTGYLLARIRHITQEEGFDLNEKKTRILRPNTRQSVTGIVVKERASLPRDVRRRVRAILHQAARTGLEAQNRDGHPNFTAWGDGMIAYFAMVHPEEGAHLRQQFAAIR